ncbi:GyrI-like domain-containing protein [Paenibacillus massiliensis]|uniref:GyrI-like domain-containing protein n=1 Tax=Paenibacillus massiliensis TaxID=225917 RepID=UPI001469BDAA|nr:GyrI-like domain-containing protein [Paenibacillus massiliensis]
MSEQKISEINREIERLAFIKYTLEESVSNIRRGLSADVYTVRLEEQAEELIIRSEPLTDLDEDEYIHWMLAFHSFEDRNITKDTSFVGYLLSKESILQGDYHSKSYFFVKSRSKPNNSAINFIKPKGMYAVAYHQGSYATIGATYERLVKYANKEGLTLADYAYEEYLIDEVTEQSDRNYVTQITIGVTSLASE